MQLFHQENRHGTYCPVLILIGGKRKPLENMDVPLICELYADKLITMAEVNYIVRMKNINKKLGGSYFLRN
jgi:hypothetical protein